MKFRVCVGLSLAGAMLTLNACGGSLPPQSGPNPVPTATATPTLGLPAIMAAGDISCDSATPGMPCKAKETSDLILAERALRTSVVVLPLGDLQYEFGTLAEFNKSYQTTWGRLNDFAHPAVGNHEYETRLAGGYFDYFATKGVVVGARNEGWYQYDVGNWHFIALNSNCSQIGGCGEGSAQYRFLAADLARNRLACTVAYWHHQFLSAGRNGSNPELLPMMRLLHTNSVEIVLSGHDHSYERFNLITPDQVPDTARGTRQFVVGTGGRDLYEFPRVLPNSAMRLNDNYGALRIVMKDGSYEWAFVTTGGFILDPGVGTCF